LRAAAGGGHRDLGAVGGATVEIRAAVGAAHRSGGGGAATAVQAIGGLDQGAGAGAVPAFGARAACVDGNVVRVLARLTADPTGFRDGATAARATR